MEILKFIKENKFLSFPNIYINPHIPEKHISNAIKAYGFPIEPDEIVVLIDDTTFGSGKNGILICEHRLLIRELFSNARVFEYESIESISCEGRRLFINGNQAYKLSVPGKNELEQLFQLLNQWISKPNESMNSRKPLLSISHTEKTKHGMENLLKNIENINLTDKVHIHPNIPEKKLISAINSYGKGVLPEDVIILVDDTAFGSCKDGILITDKNIYIKIFTESFRAYEWESIESINIKKRAIYINNTPSGKLIQAGQKDIGEIFDAINKQISENKYQNHNTHITPTTCYPHNGTSELIPEEYEIKNEKTKNINHRNEEPEILENLSIPHESSAIDSTQKNDALALAKIIETEVNDSHKLKGEEQQLTQQISLSAENLKAKNKLFSYITLTVDENRTKIIPLIREKTGAASLAALQDDSNIEKLAGFIYTFLPNILRLALKEQVFVQFMLDNRDKILSSLLSEEIENNKANINSEKDNVILDISKESNEDTIKQSSLTQNEISSTEKRAQFFSQALFECNSYIAEFIIDSETANRTIQNSADFKQRARAFHITTLCTDTLKSSIKCLEKIREGLCLTDNSEKSAFDLDSVLFVMLTYSTTFMSFLLRTEAGYDEDECSNTLAPIFDTLIVSYAQHLIGNSDIKTLRDIANPYERVFASETMKNYKKMSGLFAKNIERQDSESLSGFFEYFTVNASTDVFPEPSERFKLSSKMSTEIGRQTILSAIAELNSNLEAALVQYLKPRKSQ